MKSLSLMMIAPPFAPLSFHLSKTKPFSFLSSKSPIFNSNFNNPKFLTYKTSPKSLIFPLQCRAMHTDASQKPLGEIHVIIGPMFAGKTTTLLRRIQAESQSGRSVAIVKSSKDDRYGLDSIVTHDGVKYPCFPLNHLSSFRQKIGIDAYNKIDVIGIDEAQFFEDLHGFCQEAADQDGKTVIVAGLDGDYMRRSFGSVLEIIPLADSVTKLNARCEICGKHAYFTLRKTEEAKTELIGGSEVYMPVCRHHYVGGQVVREAARIVSESHKVHCDSFKEVRRYFSSGVDL